MSGHAWGIKWFIINKAYKMEKPHSGKEWGFTVSVTGTVMLF